MGSVQVTPISVPHQKIVFYTHYIPGLLTSWLSIVPQKPFFNYHKKSATPHWVQLRVEIDRRRGQLRFSATSRRDFDRRRRQLRFRRRFDGRATTTTTTRAMGRWTPLGSSSSEQYFDDDSTRREMTTTTTRAMGRWTPLGPSSSGRSGKPRSGRRVRRGDRQRRGAAGGSGLRDDGPRRVRRRRVNSENGIRGGD